MLEGSKLLVAIVDDGVEQPEGSGAFEFAAEQGFQDLAVDAGEVFSDVALQDVAMGAGEVGEAAQGAVGAVAEAVGVGVADEGALEDGHNDVAESVMHDPIAIGSG